MDSIARVAGFPDEIRRAQQATGAAEATFDQIQILQRLERDDELQDQLRSAAETPFTERQAMRGSRDRADRLGYHLYR